MPGARLWGDWAVDNEGVYFLDYEGERKAVLRFFRFATRLNEQISVWEHPGGQGLVRLSLAPDGRWLVFDRFDHSESDLMLVENFR